MKIIKIYNRDKKTVLIPSYENVTNYEIWKLIRDNEVKFIGPDPHLKIIEVLKTRESKSEIDLNKIIKSGGFIKYINKLERNVLGE